MIHFWWVVVCPERHTLDPAPRTLDTKPLPENTEQYTLDPATHTLDCNPLRENTEQYTLDPAPQTLDPLTLTSKECTPNTKH